jgi:hypothetical protein
MCPTLILNVIKNESSKFRLLFLHSELDNFMKAVQCMERQSICAPEVTNELKKNDGDDERRRIMNLIQRWDFLHTVYFKEKVWSVFSM